MKETLSHTEEGRIGEKIVREYLKSMGAKILQIDWMSYEEGKYRLNEVKYQEIFKPPPFYGHGLPAWQIEARMDFFHRTRIIPWLYVVEKSDYEKKVGFHLIWLQSLVALEMGKCVDTEGANPRRIYNIESFNKIYFAKKENNDEKKSTR